MSVHLNDSRWKSADLNEQDMGVPFQASIAKRWWVLKCVQKGSYTFEFYYYNLEMQS